MQSVRFTNSASLIAVGSLIATLLPLSATTPATANKRTKTQISSIPAAGNATSGVWVSWAAGADGTSRTRMDLPKGEGVPLMADWDGDGKTDLGVYFAGQFQLRFTGVIQKPKVLGKKVDYQPIPELQTGIALFTLGLPTDVAVTGVRCR